MKTRRPHTKSRNGCIECKRRHIRCDEGQPSCTNCEVAERTCFFPKPKTAKQKQKQGQSEPDAPSASLPDAVVNSHATTNGEHANMDVDFGQMPPLEFQQQPGHSSLGQVTDQTTDRSLLGYDALPPVTSLESNVWQIPSPASPMGFDDVHTPPADCHPGFLSIPNTISKAVFTPQHMILLYHANGVPNFTGPNRSAVEIAVRRAVDSPYLIDEVLAFTAFHIAYLYPGSAVPLRHLATELQTRALASFTRLTELVPNDHKPTAVPRFLFSGILGRHVLADTLAHYRADFHQFIDRFVACLDLNRGIRAVTPPAQYYLSDSELQPFLAVILNAQKNMEPGNECDPLKALMDNSDLSEASTSACRQAIEILQWAFDICKRLDEEDYPQAAAAFAVRVEIGFADMLRKYRPEALVVLAYYGVVLHRCRSFWAFGDAGASMIRAIAAHLGSYWQKALEWPLRVLETEGKPDPIIVVSGDSLGG